MSQPGTLNFPTSLNDNISLIDTTNRASSILSSGITATSTVIPVSSTAQFPSSGIITIDNEYIAYSAKTLTQFGTVGSPVVRGIDGSSADVHSTSAQVQLVITALMHNTLSHAIQAIEAKLGIGSSTATLNKFLAGTGAGATAFRTLLASDIPSLDASIIGSGSIADARLSANVPLKNATNIFSVEQVFSGNFRGPRLATGNQGVIGPMMGLTSVAFGVNELISTLNISDVTGARATLVTVNATTPSGTYPFLPSVLGDYLSVEFANTHTTKLFSSTATSARLIKPSGSVFDFSFIAGQQINVDLNGTGSGTIARGIQSMMRVEGALIVPNVIGAEIATWIDDTGIVTNAIGVLARSSNHNSIGGINLTNLIALQADMDCPRATTLNAIGLNVIASNGNFASHGYGVKIDSIGSSADPWGIYVTGNWPNYFGGPIVLGNNGHTMRLQPGTYASDFILTLPSDNGVSGQFLKTSGGSSSTSSWSDLPTGVFKLGSNVTIDLSVAGATALYTPRTGYKTVITHVVMRKFSGTVPAGSATFSIGANAPNYNGAVSLFDFGALVPGSGSAVLLIPDVINNTQPLNLKQTLGAAGDITYINIITPTSSTVTCVVDIFGYDYQ